MFGQKLLQAKWARTPRQQQNRGIFVLGVFMLCFCVVAIKLVHIAIRDTSSEDGHKKTRQVTQLRPDLIDRHGVLLATDIQLASLYADARKIQDVDEAIEQITAYLPDLDTKILRKRLTSKKSFVWIKREISPKQQSQIHDLGIPGLKFKTEYRRVYPGGRLASQVLGHVNIDNVGVAGLEKYFDKKNEEFTASIPTINATDKISVTLDIRVQHALDVELKSAMEKYQSKAAAGLVLDVQNGEVLGLVSLPGYDPHKPKESLKKGRFNRIVAGLYEMGSTMKTFTFAAALDEGMLKLSDKFDAREPIKIGRFKISDFHAQNRILSAEEVFIHSSNIGTAKLAMHMGADIQKEFLKKSHILGKVTTELPGVRTPKYPSPWKDIATMTVSYGHGISITPLQLAASTAALVNGGIYYQPTFILGHEDRSKTERIVSPQTSEILRGLMRLNVIKGSGKKADITGYRVGGKTGTAEKVVDGKYAKDALLTSFVATFPTDAPKYLVLVMLDEPKGIPETNGKAAAGWNAVPVTGHVIKRIAPLLKILPEIKQAN